MEVGGTRTVLRITHLTERVLYLYLHIYVYGGGVVRSSSYLGET